MTLSTEISTLCTTPAWWQAAIGPGIGFFLATMSGLGVHWCTQRWKRRAHWAALKAEVDFCRREAETYLQDAIGAPLYRLPAVAFSQSFPALLADAAMTEMETVALMRFFAEVETLNRGLDLAQKARERLDEAGGLDFARQERTRLNSGSISDNNERLRAQATAAALNAFEAEVNRNQIKAGRLVPQGTESYFRQAWDMVNAHLRKCI